MNIKVGLNSKEDPNLVYAKNLAMHIQNLHQTYVDKHIHETCSKLQLKCNVPSSIMKNAEKTPI